MTVSASVLDHRKLWSPGRLSGAEVLSLLDSARRLAAADRTGAHAMPLRGKHLALLRGAGEAPGATRRTGCHALRQAAERLGARVSLLADQDADAPHGAELKARARLLGRFYDALDCTGTTPAVLRDLDGEAGVPVYDGLAGAAHPARALAALVCLQEQAGRPLAGLQVAWPAGTPLGLAERFQALAAQAGLGCRLVDEGDAELQLTEDGQGEWRLTAADRCVGGPDARGPGAAGPWQRTLQALLLHTMA
ncbi:hypothetical protein OOT46_18295 [Aquabacterium sp. A7-Y]|uniref:hypothetical protein n=1 Tax=Aquabacterium sp. A7-Y TaxID=1349605 RepID=UPI00223E689C|nr:hypothetical protein [Aquabacterium sp. A7-Y]MCW7539788.1 hypothetical protein [Aquabacterium sp. A7-Y]